jgi:hypothetical protein
MCEMKNAYKNLAGKPKGKRPLERRRRRWNTAIEMDVRDIGVRVWIGLMWVKLETSGGLL